MLHAKVGAFIFAAELNRLVQLRVKITNQNFPAMFRPVSSFMLSAPAAWPGATGLCETACALVRRP